jgi:hypothetical protein
MTVGMVFSISVLVIRRHLRTCLGLAFLLIGPAALLTSAVSVRLNEVLVDLVPIDANGSFEAGLTISQGDVDRLVGAATRVLLAGAFAGVLGSLAALGFSAIVGADHGGRPMTLGEALGTCLRRAPSALGVVVLTTLLTLAVIAAGVAFAAAALALLPPARIEEGGPGAFLALLAAVATAVTIAYLSIRWAVALPAVVLEPAGTRAALVRSWRLTSDNVLRTLAVVAFAVLATAVLSSLVAEVLGLLLVDILGSRLGLDAAVGLVLVSALASVLLAPLSPVVSAVLYHDLLMRAGRRRPAGSVRADDGRT